MDLNDLLKISTDSYRRKGKAIDFSTSGIKGLRVLHTESGLGNLAGRPRRHREVQRSALLKSCSIKHWRRLVQASKETRQLIVSAPKKSRISA